MAVSVFPERLVTGATVTADGRTVWARAGVGKSHLASAIGRELIQTGDRVLMCRTTDPSRCPHP